MKQISAFNAGGGQAGPWSRVPSLVAIVKSGDDLKRDAVVSANVGDWLRRDPVGDETVDLGQMSDPH
ncbi:MAG: hypothetical protein GY788_16455, partial [bacterium]|nr:hypothetical protein [bacterium]